MPRATARRILVLAVAGGVLVDIVVPGNAPGIGVALLTAVLLAVALGLAGRDGVGRMEPADAWLPVAALVLAAMPALRADPWLVLTDVMLAAACAAGTLAALGGARITRGLVPAVVATAAGMTVASFAGAIDVLGGARRPDPRAAPSAAAGALAAVRAGVGRTAPVARGLAVALPLALAFGLLFASADAVFARLAGQALDLHLDVDAADLASRTIVVATVAWAAAGVLAVAAGGLAWAVPGTRGEGGWTDSPGVRPQEGRSLGAASAAAMRSEPRLGTAEATTVLLVLDALFVAFVALQVAYLFGGRDTLAVAGMTYAQYARRGFFELVAVAALAGTLVVSLDLAVGRRSRAQLAAALVLLGLTAVVLVSAVARLRLYQDAYGWTELRFVVLVAIGWLTVALAATAALLVTRRTRWTLHVLGMLTIATVIGMNVVGPQAFVADRNLERALDPSLVPPGGRTGLDAEYLASLGDEAVPAVVGVIDRLGPADRARLEAFLDRRSRELDGNPALLGWPSWNVARERAREALAGR